MQRVMTDLKALRRSQTTSQHGAFGPGRRIVTLLIAVVAACLMTGDQASFATQRTRKIIFEIHVYEPRPGFVRQVQRELVGQGGSVSLTRSGNKFIGEYIVPDALRDNIRCRMLIQIDDPVQPWLRLQYQTNMDFTRPDSPDFKIERHFRFFPLQIEAVERDANGTERPAFPDVGFYRRTGDQRERILYTGVQPDSFRGGRGMVGTFFFSETFLQPVGTEIQVHGVLTIPGNFNNNAIASFIVPSTGAARVRLVFYAWQTAIRQAVQDALRVAGIPRAKAETISNVPINGVAGVAFADWRPVLFPYNWTSGSDYQIALGPGFNLLDPHGGDSFMHEFTHETLYRMNWQPIAPPNAGHDIEVPASIETQAWEEGLAHFIGSHLLTRIVEKKTPIGYTVGSWWIDSPNDRVREGAMVNRNQPSLNSPARTVMQNPGNWIEGVVTGSLLELYNEQGINPLTDPEGVLKAFIADLRDFCAAVPMAQWTVEEFFRHRAQNPRNRIPMFESRVVDQIALWYLLTTHKQILNVDRLVPVTLQPDGTTTVISGEVVNLRASARAFHRLVGQYRTIAPSLRARLYEGSLQIGADVPLDQPSTVPNYSVSALLSATLNNPGNHRLRAEIWGDFIDGTMELLGKSDEIEINVEPAPTLNAPAEVMETDIFPASVNVPPAARQRVKAGKVTASWSPETVGPADALTAQLQFLKVEKDKPAFVLVHLNTGHHADKPIVVKPAKFAGSAAGSWSVQNTSDRTIALERTPAKIEQHINFNGPAIARASVGGKVEARLDRLSHYYGEINGPDPTRVDKELREKLKNDQGELKALTMGDFKGYIVESKPRFYSGSWSGDAGFRECGVGAYGHGFVTKGWALIEVRYNISGNGWFDNRFQSFMEAQAAAAQAEARAIVNSLKLTPTGGITTTPYNGPNLNVTVPAEAGAQPTPLEPTPTPTKPTPTPTKPTPTPVPPVTDTESGAKSDALIKEGAALHEQKKYNEAVSSFTGAITLTPNSAEAYRRRGMAKRELKDYAGAIADFNKAISLEPNNAPAYAGRGIARERNNDVAGALADYTRAIQLNPRYENAYGYRGHLRIQQKDYAGAKADYDQVIALNPKNQVAWNNRGVAKERLGDLQGALSDFEQALTINASYELARRNAERVRNLLAGGKTGTEPGKKGETGLINLSGAKWNWFDPNADATYNVAGDAITIVAPNGNDLWPAYNFNAPRLTKSVSGDFILKVRVQGGWRDNYNGAGLTVHSGKDSVIRFERGIHGVPGGNHVVIFGFVNGRETGRAHIPFSGQDVHLKLERNGNQFTAYASADGVNWTKVGMIKVELPATVEAGLTLVNQHNSNTFRATFSGFELLKVSSQPVTSGNEVVLFKNGNIYGVSNGPTNPTTFTLRQPHIITSIQNYHWNNGRGAAGGTISLRGPDGTSYGPWQVITSPGQGGAANVYWNCTPNMTLPAGVYTVIDSNPTTWSYNGQSGGSGFTIIKGILANISDAGPRLPSTNPRRSNGSMSRPLIMAMAGLR